MGIKEGFSKQITKINMKTSSFLEENKIRTYINTLEGDIKELYIKAGQEAFNMWKMGSDNKEKMVSMLAEIDEKQKQIAEQEQMIKDLADRNKQVLGERETATSAQQANNIVCPNCGTNYPTGANFCRVCGTKLR